MDLAIDVARGRALASRLHALFSVTGAGILGHKTMPEDEPPAGVVRASLQHLLFITLTVAIDYQRDAPQLWTASRAAYADPVTRYLYEPAALHATPFSKIVADLHATGVSRKPRKDADIWHTVGIAFLKKYGGDPRRLLGACNHHAPTVLARLQNDTHLQRDRPVPDFPFLRGPKIGPLWLRMLRDNVGVALHGMQEIPIPVDVHVARATFTTGVVRGEYQGPVGPAFRQVRAAWKQAVVGMDVPGPRPMVALDVDEPLWHLSKYGCSPGRSVAGGCCHRPRCPAGGECMAGLVQVSASKIEVRT